MKIGIVCALESEIQLLRKHFSDVTEHKIGGVRITEIRACSHTLLLTISGIGKTRAAMAVQTLAVAFGCDVIINTGLAGGCGDAKPGTAVLAQRAVYHDFDLNILSNDRESYPDGFETDGRLTEYAGQALENAGIDFVRGTAATGDIFVADKFVKDAIVKRTGCVCLDMEAAAIAHAASVNSLPTVIVKVISDSADEQAATDFEAALRLYAERCAAFVREMVRIIN